MSGPGLDVGLSRTYNNFAEAHDGDNGDKWQLSSARRVFGLTGSVNTAGCTIRRLASDGSVSTYLYETRNGVAAYWTTDGAGAHDKLTVSDNRFTWTDGDTQVTETYDADPYAAGDWRIVAQTDTTGHALSLCYNGYFLSRMTTNSGEYMEYGWSGNQLTHVSLWTASPVTGGLVQSTRTRYAYDGANRLVSVTTDLSPEDNGIGDGRSYTTSYSYDTNVQRSATPGTGAFRGGSTWGSGFAEFGNDYDAINSYAQGSAGGLYTVRGGDSLQAIALQLWGDAGLWYKLAEANGLAAGAALAEGRTLQIPTGVSRVHHNAGTMKPYDPAEALGDTSPTTPTPAQPKKNKCGVVGAILLAAVAIAVTVIAPIGGSSIGAAMANAALGSVASQAVGVATGIQDKFSFKAVALSALTAGVMKGVVGDLTPFGQIAKGAERSLAAIGNAAVSGAVGSAIGQGIGIALGLQDKFSWAGVAAAGVAGAVGQGLGGKLPSLSGENVNRSFGNIVAHTGVGAASLMASAATRSALEGSSFGGNIMAGLPDVLGQVVGRALGSRISDPATRAMNRNPAQMGGAALLGGTPSPSRGKFTAADIGPIGQKILASIIGRD